MAIFNDDQLNRLFPRPVAIAHTTNTYDLLYDADNDLYYIENNSKED